MNQEKLKEVFSDEVFVEALTQMKTVEDVHGALKKKGLDFSTEEVKGVMEKLRTAKNGELADEQLAGVAGGEGMSANAIFVVVAPIVKSVASGAVSGAVSGVVGSVISSSSGDGLTGK